MENILDESVMRNLRRLVNEDKVVNDLILLFQDSSRQTLREMEKALINKDLSLVAQLCHRLKGSSASLGGHTLAARCEELQEAALLGAYPLCLKVFTLLKTDFQSLVEAFSQLSMH